MGRSPTPHAPDSTVSPVSAASTAGRPGRLRFLVCRVPWPAHCVLVCVCVFWMGLDESGGCLDRKEKPRGHTHTLKHTVEEVKVAASSVSVDGPAATGVLLLLGVAMVWRASSRSSIQHVCALRSRRRGRGWPGAWEFVESRRTPSTRPDLDRARLAVCAVGLIWIDGLSSRMGWDRMVDGGPFTHKQPLPAVAATRQITSRGCVWCLLVRPARTHDTLLNRPID